MLFVPILRLLLLTATVSAQSKGQEEKRDLQAGPLSERQSGNVGHESWVKERRSVELRPRAAKAKASSYYTALVAFGASYTDNAHSRPTQYAGSLRQYYPFSSYGGRYTNGKVAVEYMVASGTSPALKAASGTSVKLIDYAYGGSQISNSLTSGSSPATQDQVAYYLSDLAAGSVSIGSGKVLHYINTGINPLTQIWTTAINAGSSSSAITKAKASVTANVNAIAAQLRSVNANSVVYSKVHGADFIIVGIPPLEIVPTFSDQVGGDATKLKLLKTLASRFNSELASFASTFAGETKNGKAWYFDTSSLWYNMQSSPAYYGIKASPITKTCYNSGAGTVCKNPADYWYFDSLHPTTVIMKILATKINTVVKAGQ